MGIVQTFKFAGTGVAGGGTSVYTLSSPVSAGDQIILAVGTVSTATAPTVTDDSGNSYTMISGQPGGGDSHYFSVWNATANAAGTPTITVTINPSFGGTTNMLTEGMTLTGVGLIELTSPVNNSGFSSSWPSVALTPMKANEILVTFDWAYAPPASITDDFVSDETGTIDPIHLPLTQLDLAHKIVTEAGTYQSHWSQASSNEWKTVLVSFPVVSSVCYPVSGYLLTSMTDAKSALQNVMAANFIDCVESDFKLTFVPRGAGASVLTIPEDDLGAMADKAKLVETFTQMQELPREVEVLFIDPSINWQQNKQQKQRSSRVVKTKQKVSMSLPMVLNIDQARQIAERTLYLAHLERRPWAFNLFRPTYMALDPTDICQFVYQGNTYTMRVTGNTIGVQFSVALNGVSEDSNAYISTVTGGKAQGVPTGGGVPAVPTVLFLFDLPYLQDSDASVDRSQTGYYIGDSAISATWRGAVNYNSLDDTDFNAVNSGASLMSYGTATNTLGVPISFWGFDDLNTLDVVMQQGTLASDTDYNLLTAGNNALIVGGEVIQFGVANMTAPMTYTLSHLLRGRRNTEYAESTHGASETVVVPVTGLQHETDPLVLIGIPQFFRGVTIGQNIGSVSDTDLTLAGNDLKPAMPVHIKGSRDGGNNLTIGWTRRTRYAGDWLDNTGHVPLNEDDEQYSIDIYDSQVSPYVPFVVRTIVWTPGTYDVNGNPYATYSAADQTTDFGTPQSAVTLEIYQISVQVGRGFPGSATI